MKKLLLLSVAMFSAVAAMAQSAIVMHVKTADGADVQHAVSDIDQIEFVDQPFADVYRMFPITIDPQKCSTPDDSDAAHGCVDGDGNEVTEAVGGGLDALFNRNGFFHSCHFKGHKYDEKYYSYVDIDLGKEVQSIAFEMAARYFEYGGDWLTIYLYALPKHVAIYAENNGEWVKIGEAGGDDESEKLANNYDESTGYVPVGAFSAEFPFSKVRFSVIKGAGDVSEDYDDVPGLCQGTMERVAQAYWSAGHLTVYGN